MSREIRLTIYFLLGLMIGGYAAVSRADYPAVKQWTYGQPTAAASVAAGFAAWDAANPNNPVCAQGTLTEQSMSASQQYRIIGGGGLCNIPGTTTWSLLNVTASWTCPSGGVYSDGICHVTVNCVVGAASTTTYFTGCFDVDGIGNGCDATGGAYPAQPSTLCNGTCWQTAASYDDCSSPVGGGPITCTVSGTLTGSQCSSGDQQIIPPESQKCPDGYAIGTVSGVAGCYKTGTPSPSTSTTTSSTQGDVTTKVTTTINPATNTTTTTTTTTNNVTNTSSTTVQNSPTNSSLPMGDPDGKAPPGSAGQSPKGTSSGNPSNNPDQNPTCGWPGGPPCKIDESGTPTDGALTTQKTDYETKSTERKNQIDSLGLQGDHGMVWDWVFPMPSGGCSALSYGASGHYFTIDPCEKLGLVRDLLGFILYIGTALMLVSIATQSNTGGK